MSEQPKVIVMSPEELWAMDEEENQKRLAQQEFHELTDFDHKQAADFKFFAEIIGKQGNEIVDNKVIIHGNGEGDYSDYEDEEFFDIVQPTVK